MKDLYDILEKIAVISGIILTILSTVLILLLAAQAVVFLFDLFK